MGGSCTYVLGFKKAGAETGHRKRGWEVQVFDTATIDLQLLLLKFRLREVVEYLDYAWGLAASDLGNMWLMSTTLTGAINIAWKRNFEGWDRYRYCA